MKYVSRAKDPVRMDTLSRVLYRLQDQPDDTAVCCAILLMYYGALRQSEVGPRTSGAWDPMSHPTRNDISTSRSRLVLKVKHAKNLQKANQSRTVTMAATDTHLLCPVTTYNRVFSQTPTRSPRDPLLMFRATRSVMPISHIMNRWRKALREVGEDPTKLSLDSLKKSAATQAHRAGLRGPEIQAFGGWRSAAYKTYVRASLSKANATLINSLKGK